ERAPPEPNAEFGKSEGEVRLLMVIVEFAGCALDTRKSGNAADRGKIMPHRRVEPVGADEVAALQGQPGEQQPGVDRVVEPADALDRFQHKVAGVERHDNVMV